MSSCRRCAIPCVPSLLLSLVLSSGCQLIAGYDEASFDATSVSRDAAPGDVAGDGHATDGASDTNATDGATDAAASERDELDASPLDAPTDSGGSLDALTADASADSRPIDDVPQLLPGLLPTTNGAQAGFAVAVSGDWVAVGAPGSGGSVTTVGEVHLWHCVNSHCTWKQTLEKEAGSRFGVSLALVGDFLAVGAPGMGNFFLYELSGDTWVAGQPMNATSTDIGFAATLAMDSQHLAVSYGEINTNDKHVAIYPLGPPVAPPSVVDGTSDSFGDALAIAGETLLVGDPALDNTTGGVEVFELRTGKWSSAKTLRPADITYQPPTGSECGSSIAFDADLIVFSCRYHHAVFPFQLANKQWDPLAAFTLQATLPLAFVDIRVALSGRTLLMGTPRRTANNATESGDIVSYEKTLLTEGWNGPRFHHMAPPQAGAHFGQAVALDGDLAVAGAPDYVTSGGAGGGAAFVFTPW